MGGGVAEKKGGQGRDLIDWNETKKKGSKPTESIERSQSTVVVGVYRRPFMPVSNGSASIVFCDVITNSSSSHSYAQQLFLSIQLQMILQ